MKITEPGLRCVQSATQGDLAALDELLLTIQPGVYNLAVRMLGHRENAADATQDILMRVVTHLSSFRGESRFSTWVHQVARRHLLDAITQAREFPEVSLEAMNARLQIGLEYTATLGDPQGQLQSLSPQDKLQARQVALACTQNMLMTLERDQRLAYVLDVVFNLPSKEAAAVMDCTPETYRQRLARAQQARCIYPKNLWPGQPPGRLPLQQTSARLDLRPQSRASQSARRPCVASAGAGTNRASI